MQNFLKNPRVQAGLGLIVVILLGWWLAKTPAKNGQNPTQSDNNQQSQQSETPKTETKTATDVSANWEGTLKLSDNPQKGNLMLLTADKKIYIHTSRDFSSLLDKQVVVTYEGTSDAFRLGDITEKLPKNSDFGN